MKNVINTNEIKVVVICSTYNQEEYIEEALRGFVMQKTDFIFVAIVLDDASTDGTADVIKKYENAYPDIVKPYYLKENHHSQEISKDIYLEDWFDRAKYIALCEGDDYWIDALKLQKQVDFLESNEDYGLVHTAYKVLDSSNNIFKIKRRKIKSGNVFNDIIYSGNNIVTGTTLFRSSIYKAIPKLNDGQGFLMGDFPLWIEMSRITMFKYLNDVTAVYRVLPNSASHKSLKHEISFFNSALEIHFFYLREYGLPVDDVTLYARYYSIIIGRALTYNDIVVSKRYYELLKGLNVKIPIKTKIFHNALKYNCLRVLMSIIRKVI